LCQKIKIKKRKRKKGSTWQVKPSPRGLQSFAGTARSRGLPGYTERHRTVPGDIL
jgi:hypothetical protein